MKIRNINFRQSKSERSGERSYSNFRKEMVRKFKLETVKEKFNFSKAFGFKKGNINDGKN